MLVEQVGSYKKYAKDTILAAIANLALTLRWLILLTILSKALGTEGYGIWFQIQVTIPLLVLFSTMSLGPAMTRFLAGETNKSKISTGFFSYLILTLLTSILFSALMFVFAEPFANAVFGGAGAVPFVKLAAFLVLLTAIDGVVTDYFVTLRQIGKYSIFLFGQAIGEIALVAYLVFSGFGLYGAIAALLITRALLFITGFSVVKPQIRFSAPSFSVIKPYLSFSLPLVFISLCWWIYNLSDRYIIGIFLGAEAIGIYSAAYVLATVGELFYSPLTVVLFPAITYFYENDKIQEVKTHLKYSLKFYLMLAIPVAFGASILAKSLLATLTSFEFIAGSSIIPVVAIATLLFHSSSIIMRVPMLFKRTKVIGLIDGACAAISVGMNVILVPLIGILGAAISALVVFMLRLIAISIISFKQLSFDVNPKFIAKAVISSLVMGAAIWWLNPIGTVNILLSIIAGSIIYFLVLVLLRGFTRQEYSFLRAILRGVKG